MARRSKASRYQPGPARSASRAPLADETLEPVRRRKPGWRARLAYAFDNVIARQPHVILWWMAAATLGVVLIATLVVTITRITGVNGSDSPDDFFEAFWQALLRVIDTGTVAADQHWAARLVGIVVTIAGIFLAGTLIGLIANLLDQKIVELRKGHSQALETDHTLILGWSARVPTIVGELLEANRSRRKAAIVIVADEDKTRMEDTLRRSGAMDDHTRVVCRSGRPWSNEALTMGRLETARSVIITASADDAEAVKAVLAIHANGQAHPGTPIVVEVQEHRTCQSLRAILGDSLITISSDEVVANLTTQACRQRGIGAVFDELLDFQGSEIYTTGDRSLIGQTYGDACLAYRRSSVLGIDTPGELELNPRADRVLTEADRLLVSAEDDAEIRLEPVVGRVLPDGGATEVHRKAERIDVLGWSSLGPRVLRELDEFCKPGTSIEVVVDPRLVDPESVQVELRNSRLSVTGLDGGPEDLARHVAERRADECIVLGYRGALDSDEADARTLLTLLAIHETSRVRSRTVIELLDQRHTPLAEATGADDFVVSDQLTSRMLAQLSEQPRLQRVLQELFTARGATIQLRPGEALGALTPDATFGDLVATGLRRGVTAIGWVDTDTAEVDLSPDKAVPLQWRPQRRVVVLANS